MNKKIQNNSNLATPQIVSNHAFGVNPDKIGEIALIIDTDRINDYCKAFDKVLYELRGGVYSGITGLVSGKEISAIYSKGPADIADCVSFLGMSKTKCRTLISTSSIGGLEKSMDMGDLVIANEATGVDSYSSLLAMNKNKPLRDPFENRQYPTGELLTKMKDSVKKIADQYEVNFHKGKVFTIPGVSFENKEFLQKISDNGCIGVNMGVSQFYAASAKYGFNSISLSWVTDLPLTRSFFYKFHNPVQAKKDFDKRSPIWLNMANIMTSIVRAYIGELEHE